MNFKSWSIALVVAALVAPISASALGVSIVGITNSGGTGNVINPDQTITLELLLENTGGANIGGLGISVWGYDAGVLGIAGDNHLTFVSGLNGTAFGTAYFGPGASTGSLSSNPVSENGGPFPANNELNVQAFNGVQVLTSNGDGSFDSGANGLQTNGSDVHMTVTFSVDTLSATAGSPGSVTLNVGTGTFGNAAIEALTGTPLSFSNATPVTFTVVPEPGSALLMGLGLAGLASFRRN